MSKNMRHQMTQTMPYWNPLLGGAQVIAARDGGLSFELGAVRLFTYPLLPTAAAAGVGISVPKRWRCSP